MSSSGAGPKFQERTILSTRVKSELDRIFELLLWLVSRKTARDLVRAASSVVDDPDLFAAACARAVDEVYACVDPTLLPFDTVAAYVEWIARRVAGQILEPPERLRLGPLHHLYVGRDDADADAIRQAIRSGEVWVNATELDRTSWDLVGSWVQFQRRVLGQKFGQPGRKPRSGTTERDEVAVRVARAPNNKAAWIIVREAGLGAGPLRDRLNPKPYPSHKELLRRLRKRGHELLGS
jgi:hypothetical protein